MTGSMAAKCQIPWVGIILILLIVYFSLGNILNSTFAYDLDIHSIGNNYFMKTG